MHPGSLLSDTVVRYVQGAPGPLSFLHLVVQHLKGKGKVHQGVNRIFHQHLENVQWQLYCLDTSSFSINLGRGQTFVFFVFFFILTTIYQHKEEFITLLPPNGIKKMVS